MAKFKMNHYGAINGIVSKRHYSFSKDEIIEAAEGEFHSSVADVVEEEKHKAPEKKSKYKSKKK